jgi:pyruvate/2-oxoglutarate dehydrogenase complex dihydrolipoamide dehydrogenase (E3) component
MAQSRFWKLPNLDVIRGEASFIDARTVKVEGAGNESLRLSAEKIFINTGAKPVVPPIDGLSRVPSLDSTSIMELDALPKHLLIVGGGYIAIRRTSNGAARKVNIFGCLFNIDTDELMPIVEDRVI